MSKSIKINCISVKVKKLWHSVDYWVKLQKCWIPHFPAHTQWNLLWENEVCYHSTTVFHLDFKCWISSCKRSVYPNYLILFYSWITRQKEKSLKTLNIVTLVVSSGKQDICPFLCCQLKDMKVDWICFSNSKHRKFHFWYNFLNNVEFSHSMNSFHIFLVKT